MLSIFSLFSNIQPKEPAPINPNTPAGFMEDGLGRLVPISKVPECELKRDQFVRDLVRDALAMEDALRAFKANVYSRLLDYLELDTVDKNCTLTSYDQRVRIAVAFNKVISSNEKIAKVKTLLEEWLNEEKAGSDDDLKQIVSVSFELDGNGNLNLRRLLTLRRYKIEGEKWKQAMQLLDDSLYVAYSKGYIRFYTREGVENKWQQVTLDFANLVVENNHSESSLTVS